MAASQQPEKYVKNWKLDLEHMLQERIERIRSGLKEGAKYTRLALAKFTWSSTANIWKLINPSKDDERKQAWEEARGILKEIIEFKEFDPRNFRDGCVKHVLEVVVEQTLERYKHWVATGELQTNFPYPKVLGETDEILCVDKPVNFTCSYGDRDFLAPHTSGVKSATSLLNSKGASIQIHEWLALAFNFETALETRKWWEKKLKHMECICGECNLCACTQSGCCNRLDQETSGVMIVSKTIAGFPEIRKQFSSEHNMEVGGTEKFYLALVRGSAELPQGEVRNQWWKHTLEGGRGKIHIAMRWDAVQSKSLPWNDRSVEETPEEGLAQSEEGEKDLDQKKRQDALTYYKPVAWFTDGKTKQQYTLMHIQITTGRRHQIRFHCDQIGFPLAGDTKYGAPNYERQWLENRFFLHSYQAKFREPKTATWYKATSPLPEDLCNVLCGLTLNKVDCQEPFLSRREHRELAKILQRYSSNDQLLVSEEAPANAARIAAEAEAAMAKWAPTSTNYSSGGSSGSSWGNQNWDSNQSWSGGNNRGWQESTNSWDSGKGGGGKGKGNSKGEGKSRKGWKQDGSQGRKGSGASPSKFYAYSNCGDSAAAPPATADDDDLETWGAWKPEPVPEELPAQPPPAPEPVAQRRERSRSQDHREAEPAYKRSRTMPEAIAARIPLSPVPQPAVPSTPPPAPPPQVQDVSRAWRRLESRSTPGYFYYWNDILQTNSVEPPEPWEKRESRNEPGLFYYWNPYTDQTCFEKPEV